MGNAEGRERQYREAPSDERVTERDSETAVLAERMAVLTITDGGIRLIQRERIQAVAIGESSSPGRAALPGRDRRQAAIEGVRDPCTYKDTKKQYTPQPFYRCYTCFSGDREGCCAKCATACHRGHSILGSSPRARLPSSRSLSIR